MAYINVLIKYFNNFVDEINSDCFNDKGLIVKKTNELYERVINGDKNFYDVIYPHLAKDIYDLDFISECLTDCYYENVNNLSFNNDELLKVKNLEKEERFKLYSTIYKVVFTSFTFKKFVSLIRTYYLKDFFLNKNELYINDIFFDLYKAKYLNTLINEQERELNPNKRKSDYVLLKEKYLLNQDCISSYIDSNEYMNLVLKQQNDYLNDLDLLLNKIDEIGNITGLNDIEFNLLLKFIFEFRECCFNKINLLNKESIIKKISK